MPLNKKDLQAIGEVVDEKINKAIDEKVPKIIDERVPQIINNTVPVLIDDKIKKNNKIVINTLTEGFTREIGLLRFEINQRFDTQDTNNQADHKMILQKIDEVKRMENEDILALSNDIIKIKKHVGMKVVT